MKNNPFKIDFRKWALLLLPTTLRKPILYHWVYVALLPIVSVYRAFYARRMNNSLFAKCDSSIGNIKRMLNQMFKSEEGTIDVRNITPTDVEKKKVYITDNYRAPNSAFVGESYIDKIVAQKLFEVELPSDMKDEETKKQISNVVGRYSLPGYGFNID